MGNLFAGALAKKAQSNFNSLDFDVQSFLTSNSLSHLPTNPWVTAGSTLGNSLGGVVSNLPLDITD